MPVRQDNATRWVPYGDIDHYLMFIRAWIPFNAWYRIAYPDEILSDNQILKEIKNSPNRIKDQIEFLLTTPEAEGIEFRRDLEQLHTELEKALIKNRGSEIRFTKLHFESEIKNQSGDVINKCTYSVARGVDPNQTNAIFITLKNQKGRTIFSFTQTNGYSWDEVEKLKAKDLKRLSSVQKRYLQEFYEDVDPNKTVSLLWEDHQQSAITLDKIKLVDDLDKCVWGVIDILYSLRNVLFHGVIAPDEKYEQVYKYAYSVLHALIQAIK